MSVEIDGKRVSLSEDGIRKARRDKAEAAKRTAEAAKRAGRE